MFRGLPQLQGRAGDVRHRSHQQLHGAAPHLRRLAEELLEPDGEPDVPGALRRRRAPAAARRLRGGRGREQHQHPLVQEERKPAPHLGCQHHRHRDEEAVPKGPGHHGGRPQHETTSASGKTAPRRRRPARMTARSRAWVWRASTPTRTQRRAPF